MANIETISRLLTHPTWDFLLVFFFIAVGFFYGISSGRMKLIAALIALYVAALIFENFSYLDFFVKDRSLFEVFLFRNIVFAVLIVLLAILFNRILPKETISGTRVWWQIFLLSFLEVGLLMSFIFRFFPVRQLFNFSPLIQNIFVSEKAFFLWLTLPLVALFFIVRKRG
jgi:hypothetical protein